MTITSVSLQASNSSTASFSDVNVVLAQLILDLATLNTYGKGSADRPYVIQQVTDNVTLVSNTTGYPVVVNMVLGAAKSVTLPLTPVAGDTFIFVDGSLNASTYNTSILLNGHLLNGSSSTKVLSDTGFYFAITYLDATRDFQIITDSTLSAVATKVTVVDAAADTTTWPMLATSQTGNLSPATDAGLTYNATANALTATAFIGALTGNVTGDVSGSSGSCTGNAATVTTNANLTGAITSTGNATSLGSFNTSALNTALNDNDIATLAGTENLSNKTFIDDIVVNQTTTQIRPNTNDGTDNKRIILCGGGTSSQNQGSGVFVHGNEFTGLEGQIVLLAGNATGAKIANYTAPAGSAVERWYTDDNGHLIPAVTNTINFGSASLGFKDGWIQNAWTVLSDENFKINHLDADKDDLDKVTGGWDLLEDLNECTAKWKWKEKTATVREIEEVKTIDKKSKKETITHKIIEKEVVIPCDGIIRVGHSAQKLEEMALKNKIDPMELGVYKDLETGIYGVQNQSNPYLINALYEAKKRILSLEERLSALENK